MLHNVKSYVSHILFDCTCNDVIRERRFRIIEDSCPVGLLHSINVFSSREKCKLFLNAFNIKYTDEWKGIYDCVADFIFYTYKGYYEVFNSMT